MDLSVVTYNTLLNMAYLKLDKVIDKFQPDILCLQEVSTNASNLKHLETKGYFLADFSNSFIRFANIFGVATFYNPKKLQFISSQSAEIDNSIGEFFYTLLQTVIGVNKPKTVLKCDFIHKAAGKKISICNSHLIVIASNEMRINHIDKALHSLKIDKKIPLVVCGDFNFLPYRRKKLEKTMAKYNLIESSKNISETFQFATMGKKMSLNKVELWVINLMDRIFHHRMKNDYMFYRGLKLKKSERIDVEYSDHYPVISRFKI